MNYEDKLKRLPELYRHRLQIAYDFSTHNVRNSPAFETEVRLSEIAAVLWYEIYVRQKNGTVFLAAKQKKEEISHLLQSCNNGNEPSDDDLFKSMSYITQLIFALDADMTRILPGGYYPFRHKAHFWLRQKFSYAERIDDEYNLLIRRCLEFIDISKVINVPFLLLDVKINDGTIKKYLHI